MASRFLTIRGLVMAVAIPVVLSLLAFVGTMSALLAAFFAEIMIGAAIVLVVVFLISLNK